jgi:hypothetical protein
MSGIWDHWSIKKDIFQQKQQKFFPVLLFDVANIVAPELFCHLILRGKGYEYPIDRI